MNIVLSGATGFVGGEVLRQLLTDGSVAQVIVLTRRSLSVSHPKLTEIIVTDFLDYANVTVKWKVDACIWCLGVSQTAVSRQEYVTITFDYAVKAAQFLFTENPRLKFCFLSGSRADLEENSRVYYGKIKGRTEKSLMQLGPDVYSFRPAFIKPAYAGQRRPLVTRLFTPIANLADLFTDQFSVSCNQLAKCLIDVAKKGSAVKILDNKAIKDWK